MDNTNCVVKIVNRSKCDCSEDLVSLNKVKFNDKLVVLTSCGLLPGRDVPSYDYCICTTHLNLIMKDVETKKRRSLCLVPAALSAHPDVDNTIISIDTLKILQKRKADRTMNADSVDIVRERTGFVLPVGTPICPNCRIKLLSQSKKNTKEESSKDFMIDEEQPRLAGDSHHEIHEPLQDTMQTVSEKVQSTLSSQPECGEPLLKKRKGCKELLTASSQHEVLELLNDTILPTVEGQSKLSSQKNVHKPLTMSKESLVKGNQYDKNSQVQEVHESLQSFWPDEEQQEVQQIHKSWRRKPRDISSESLSEEIEYQILDSQDTISTLSQESDSDNERMYIIDKLVELLKLQHIPFPQRSFTDYSHKMKKLYISHISRMIMRLLDILFPGESCVIFNKIVEEAGVSQHTENKNFSGSLLDGLVASYNKAETWQARRQVLSVLTSSLTYSNTMKLIPEVTQYRYYMAQKHALQYGSALPVEPKDTTRARMDLKKLDNFMDFITSPYIVKDLPYGERRIKLSTGETVETPNVIRSMGPAAIITQYKFLSEEQNFTPLADSTMFKILSECSATVRKSLEGLDYFVAEGGRAFTEIDNLIDVLTDHGLLSTALAKDFHSLVLSSKRYIKTDFKIHITEESDVADHCRQYSLSDPTDRKFNSQCEHQHHSLCPNCEQLRQLLQDIEGLVSKLNSPNKEDYKFKASQAITNINNWKMHTLRARNQEVAKTDIFSSLSSNAVLIILDWAMKYLPRKFREDNCDWFAKRGIPWHISVVFRKNPELESIAYIHLFDSNVVQGSATTTAVILDVAQSIKHQFPEIKSFHLWSDNAGCYKSSETIQTLFCSKLFASYDFCEMQDGKGACDRIAATIKSAIRRYVNEGHDVVSPLQFKQAVEKKMCAKYPVKVCAIMEEPKEKLPADPIPSISLQNNFRFEEDGIRCWKAYGTGEGKLIPIRRRKQVISYRLKIVEQAIPAVFFPVKYRGIKKKTSNEQDESSALLTCPTDGCVKSFSSFQDLADHSLIGDCKLKAEVSNRDLVKNRYVIKLEENLVKEDVQVTLESEKLPCNAQTLLPMGWALKPERKSKHFSEKQKKFLVAKFDVGLKTGRKEDPCLVAKEMRFASEGGKKLFSLDEFLTPQQINSFFSRHAKKVRTETSEATREKTISNIENTLIEQEK